jgi:hypothetical protein
VLLALFNDKCENLCYGLLISAICWKQIFVSDPIYPGFLSPIVKFKQISVNLLCFNNLGQLGSINFTLFLHLLLLISIILLIVILHLRLPLFNLCVNLIPKAVSHNAFPQIFLEFDGWPAQELVQIAELPEIVERNEIEFGEFD